MGRDTLILQNSRPLPWYGAEDWLGGDVEEEMENHDNYIAEWDKAYQSLTWFQKIKYYFFWLSKYKKFLTNVKNADILVE